MKAARFFGFLVVLLLVLGVGGFLSADYLARRAIERGGTAALGVETTLEESHLGLFSGAFAFEGLAVANPAGFPGEHFLTLDEGRLEVGVTSLFGPRVEAPLLALSGLRLALESQDGRTNFGALLERLEGGAGEDQDAASGGGKQFVLDRVELRDVVVRFAVGVGPLARREELRLEEIVLTDLDSREFTLEELTAHLVRVVLERASQAGLDGLPADVLDEFGGLGRLLDLRLDEASLDELQEAGEALKDLFERR